MFLFAFSIKLPEMIDVDLFSCQLLFQVCV